MADTGFRQQYTTTTTETSNTTVQRNVRYDPLYIRTMDGILKISEVLLSLLGFICIQCTYLALHPTGKWFSTVSMFGVWVTGILLVTYLFHVVEKFYKIPWIKFELGFCTVLALCYLIASFMAAVLESNAFRAAAFFGFSAMLVYACDAYFKFRYMTAGKLAQGERQIDTKITTISTPQTY